MKRWLLFLTGLLLLPLGGGLSHALLDLFSDTIINQPPWVAPALLAFCAGFGVWTFIYICAPPSIRLYIWSHELTHAVWGVLTGSRLGRIRVTRNGGSVALSEPGVWTTLAPYFIPFYTLVLILLRLLLGIFFEMNTGERVWCFLYGITWGFHFTYTIRSLMQHQPDIQTYGRLFSYAIIIIFNVLLLGYLLVAITPTSVSAYHTGIFNRTVSAYQTTGQQGYRLVQAIIRKCPVKKKCNK